MDNNNYLHMRPPLFLVLYIYIGIFGCKRLDAEKASFEIATYSYDHIEYPIEDVEIPDSLEVAYWDNFFAPWNIEAEELLATLGDLPGKELPYLEKYLEDDEWYGENKKPHKRWLREEVVNNVNTESFPNFIQKGITIAHTNLRRLPTHRPGFDIYSKAGEGYPFDYFQETNLWANTPLQLLHQSIDKQWCYVISPYYKGWVSIHDIAIVDESFISEWLTGTYCLPVSDKTTLQNSLSNYAINAKMGMVLPYEETSENTNSVRVYFVNADEYQKARILKADVNKDDIAFDEHKFNGDTLKELVSQLVGRPYGWGGNLENRDCSSLIRDLMATYRIWLPRDSKDQIEVGDQYALMDSAEEKIKLIIEKGIPFLTILRKKGHNMLYLGNDENGEPLILHAIWGLETSYSNEQLAGYLQTYPIEGIHQDEEGQLIGRFIIGEAVITSVMAGSGNDDISLSIIDQIYEMTNILEP